MSVHRVLKRVGVGEGRARALQTILEESALGSGRNSERRGRAN